MSIEQKNNLNIKTQETATFEPKTDKELDIEDAEKIAGGIAWFPIIGALILISNKEWQE